MKKSYKKVIEKAEANYTLLSNISFIQRESDNMRINVHALLVTEDEDFILGPSYTLRGFGTEAAWDTFNLWLDKDTQLPFSLQTTECNSHMILSDDGEAKPIFRGNALILKDGTNFFLQAHDSSRPIDVYKSTGDICKVWEMLFDKTAEYWQAPYMPRLQYGPPSMVRNHYREL